MSNSFELNIHLRMHICSPPTDLYYLDDIDLLEKTKTLTKEQ